MSQNGFEQFGRDLRRYLKTVPHILGQAVVQESTDNFRRQGYENDTGAVVPWEPRQRENRVKGRKRKNGSRSPSRPNPRQRAILVKSGRLRRSVRIVATTATSVTVGSSEVYAQAQQEGSDRGLPARPFITLGARGKDKLIKRLGADITKLLK